MEYTYSSTITEDSTQIILSDTSNLIVGLYIYGSGIISCSKIDSIDNTTTIQSTKNAFSTGTYNLTYTDINPNLWLERCQALKAIQECINERGSIIQIIIRAESNITRSSYGDIKRRTQTTTYNFKSNPIIFNPTSDQLEHAGLREDCQLTVTLSMKDFIDNSLTFEDIDRERATVKFDGSTYEIKEKTLANQFGNTFLNINLGLFRR